MDVQVLATKGMLVVKKFSVVFLVALMAMLVTSMAMSASRQEDAVTAPQAALASIEKKIKQLVKGLEYSDKVAQDFVQMVNGWKDAQGRSVLVVWKEKLSQARQDYKQDKISKAQLVKAEESIAKELSQRIRKEIGYNEKFFELADVIRHRQAQYLGYSQLVYILGNSVGLSVKAIDVTELMIPGPLPIRVSHIASIVSLTDDRTMMVDLAAMMVDLAQMPTPMISKPFELEKEFVKVGNYWELKDRDNPLRIHRRIQILDRNGLLAGIYSNRGVAYYDLDKFTKAISDYTKAIKLNPEFAEAYNNRGVAYDKLDQYTKAISDYTKAIQLNPEFAEAYTNRGGAYGKLGQYTKAISDFNKAIQLNPKDAKAYYNRGVAYGRLGQLTKAISDYTKAIQLNPKYAKAYGNRGIVYALLEKSEEAKKDLLKAVELNPALKAFVKQKSDHFKLGLKLDNSYSSNLGQHTKAISDYTKAIQLNPKDAEAYYNRGITYDKLDQYTKAISDYTKAIELNPEDAKAYTNRGNAYTRLSQYTKAISDFNKAIQLNPKDAEAYYNRGIAYDKLDQHTKAISDYTKAIKLNPKDAEAYNNRGNAYTRLSQYTKAISDFNKAIQLNPKDAEAYNNRGVTYVYLGKSEEAQKDLLKAVELNPALKAFVKKISDHFKLGLKLGNSSSLK